MRMIPFTPSERLAPYVRGITIVEANAASPSAPLPEPGLLLGIRFAGSARLLDNGMSTPLANSSVTGLRTTLRRLHTSAGGGIVVVAFRTLGAAHFFEEPLHELFGNVVGLADLAGGDSVAAIEERITEATTHATRIAIVDDYLVSRLRARAAEPIVAAAASALCGARGAVRIATLAKRLHVGQDGLEKRFRRAVGASPKQFASILRFRRLVAGYRAGSSLTTLAHEAGYFDQSHLIRDFRSFTGEPPERFLASGTYC
jgi:AraC-like DNA-binding protein